MAASYSYPTASKTASGTGSTASLSDITDDVSSKASAALDQAKDVGSEALDQVDEYLKPIGLSLKEKPVATLALLGGAAVLVGAMFMNRSRRTNMQQMLDQLQSTARSAGWMK